MKLETGFIAVFTGILALVSTGAQAHALGGDGGLAGGLAHPFMGLDHLLAMIAVGLWAAQLGRRAVWQVPLAFVAMMTAGFGLARLGLPLPVAEPMVLASVVVLGAMVAGAVQVPAGMGAALMSVFAAFHGFAHGVEMPAASPAWAYAAGFGLTTAGLHLLGVGLGRATALRQRPVFARLGGAAIAASGLALIGGM
jgi:urease accessory protein